MTESRALLERLIAFADKKVNGLKVTNYQIYTSAGQELVEEARAFLAQDTAQEAVLVRAGQQILDTWALPLDTGHKPGQARRLAAYKAKETWDKVAADTSSAAAALLAQEEALKWYGDIDNWEYEHSPECEESAPGGPCIASLACRPSCAAEKDEGRRARAALSVDCGEAKE